MKAGPKAASRKRTGDQIQAITLQAPEPVDECWRQNMVRRAGAPPLRFKGRELARHADSWSGTDTSITLWKRKTRGYVVSVDAGEVVDSVSLNTLDEVMTWLEQVCAQNSSFGQHTSIGDFMTSTAAKADLSRRLRLLAGLALDHWDGLTEPESP